MPDLPLIDPRAARPIVFWDALDRLADARRQAAEAEALSRRALLRGGSAAIAAGITAAALPGLAYAQAPAAPAAGAPATPGQPTVIDITRARVDPIPIAIPEFIGVNPAGERFGRDIAGVISANLQRSGLFRPIDRSAFIQRPADAVTAPRFADWRVINSQALVTGRVEAQGDGRLRVEFRLWDVLPEQQIEGTAFTSTQQNWRRIAHIISDRIYERLLGEKGYFDTRIVYIAESGPRDRRVKRLAIMDQDSENHRFLTDGSWLTLTPRFHPSTNIITFMSFFQNRPRVYLFNIDSGSQQVLGDFPGMTFAPRFSPDGGSVVMSVTAGDGSNIVQLDLRGRSVRRLTSSGAIDTSPCFSPDGSQITFNSDRGGNQQLYVMDSGGGGVRRISYGEGRYATPVWSPRGDLIAFTRFGGGRFAIGVMQPDGTGERLLSEGFAVEGPTFAPNGRVLAFFRESPAGARGSGYSARLASVDITGFNERALPTPLDASDPAWSPLIP
ncbi:MAG: Tol-Pal system protein TolB [Alphaproteobacteria bacterium]|nr:Tol-Pal system protein TolB [Alphaproteobacteria bacterium]